LARPIAVLRPEPANRVTAAAIEARGRTAIRLPLFAAQPVAWSVPDPAEFDALIITSTNALRHGGPGLQRLLSLPLYAVGQASAEAGRRMGFHVACTGTSGSAALLALAEAAGVRRALHLAGRERTIAPGGIVARIDTVYASDAVPVSPEQAARLHGSVALVQSARAGARLAELVTDRASIAIAAISPAAAAAAGEGWERVVATPSVESRALIDAAIALAD
jgi:uroporphyrinogen-III synthase